MLFNKKKNKEIKENEQRLRKLHGREVRYVTTRDRITNVETIIGKYGVINIKEDEFFIICNNKLIFSNSIYKIDGSELMSLDGIILNYLDNSGEKIEVVAYYKYHRK